MQFDSDPKSGGAQRLKIYAEAAAGDYWLAGAHLCIRPAIPPLMASRSVRRRLAEFPGARQQLADAALRS